MKQPLSAVVLCLLAVLGRPAWAGLLSVLDMPQHDGVSRVCQLATGDSLTQAVAAGTPLVVRVVKGAAKKECSSEDFVEVRPLPSSIANPASRGAKDVYIDSSARNAETSL